MSTSLVYVYVPHTTLIEITCSKITDVPMRLQFEGYHKILMTVLLLPDAEPRDGGGVRDGSLRKSPNEDSTIPANPSMMRWRGLICMYLPKTVFARGGGGFGGGSCAIACARC